MRNEAIFDAVQAEVAYRTEALYKARSTGGAGGFRWWKLGRRSVQAPVPEQRRPSHDQELPARANARR